jgi:steroid delta-isomerase-like uncharacterized protein
MTRGEITAFFDRRQDALERRDAAALAALHSESSRLESAMAGTLVGRAEHQRFYTGLFSTFPDFRYEPGELWIDGNRVAQVATFGGTNIGGFMGLPPSGRQIRVPAVFLFRLKDQQIEWMRSVYDFTLMLVQAGVLKIKTS